MYICIHTCLCTNTYICACTYICSCIMLSGLFPLEFASGEFRVCILKTFIYGSIFFLYCEYLWICIYVYTIVTWFIFFFSFWTLASQSLGFVSWVHVCVCVYAHVCVCIPTHVYTVCTYRVMCACRCTCIGSHTHMQARIQCMHVCTCALRTAAWLAPDLLCNRTGPLLFTLPPGRDIRNR